MIPKQCAILIGGMGTRLSPLTRETPKPLLPVGNVPFLDVLVGEALRRGFNDLVFLAGFLPDIVEQYAAGLRSRLPDGCMVRVSFEPEPLGTGGAVLRARNLLDETFLLLNGDTWFDFNWLGLSEIANGGCAVAARQVTDGARHESLSIAADGTVTGIAPRREGAANAVINGGVYLLRKAALNGFPDHFSIEADLLPTLIERSELRGRQYDNFFIDIGIPETLEAAQSQIPARRRRPAVFFDRDGVLNHDDNYVGSADRFRWVEGAKQAVRLANDRGYYAFVVTNQAGVAKGHYDEAAVDSLHRWVAAELREEGAYIDDWRYCPYHPEGSVQRYRSMHPWRKPQPGMILDLLDHWTVDASNSVLIGDQESDCAAARSAGIEHYLFSGGNLHDFLAERLPDAT